MITPALLSIEGSFPILDSIDSRPESTELTLRKPEYLRHALGISI